jgi:hypothetical protein
MKRLKKGWVLGARPAIVGDRCAMCDRVVQRCGSVGDGADPGRVQELQRHDLDRPVNPRHADAVVTDRANRTGHMGAVTIVVEGIVVVGNEIPTD